MISTLLKERETAIQQKTRWEKKIAAIDSVLAEYGNEETDKPPAASRPERKSPTMTRFDSTSAGGVGDQLKRAIYGLEGSFTINDLLSELKKEGVDPLQSSVNSALRRFTQQNFIRTIRRGKGRKPSIYRRVK